MTQHDDALCARVRERASARVDGRLAAGARERFDAHLAACDACRLEVAALRELRRRVRALPAEELPEGFAARVRERAEARATPPRARAVLLRRVAAVLLVALGLGWAYVIGREHGAAEGALSPGEVPVETVSFRSPERVRAARSVVSDLGVIDRIPSRLRRPLLKAQIDLFDLDAWAREATDGGAPDEPITELARIVSLVDDLLGEPGGERRLLELQERALRPEFFTDLPVLGPEVRIGPGPDRTRDRARVVARVGGGLPDELRAALDHVLELKESLARGNPWPAVTFHQGRPAIGADLRPSADLAVVTALGEAGLDGLAGQWLRPLRSDSPRLFRLLTGTVFSGRDPFEITVDTSSIQENLERILRLTKGSGAVVVEEESHDSGYSIKVIIRGGKER